MTPDIFEFWKAIRDDEHIHPADSPVFDRIGGYAHRFVLECLPSAYFGPLKTAPVVLLFLSPGFVESDVVEAQTSDGQRRYREMRSGTAPLPSKDEAPVWRWWSSRTSHFGPWQELRERVAFLNIGAYHSKAFTDWQMLASLPSSRVSLSWAQEVLFPEALAGRRVVVCLRSPRFWGLGAGRHGKGLFSPPVNRGGYMKSGSARDQVIAAVREMLAM